MPRYVKAHRKRKSRGYINYSWTNSRKLFGILEKADLGPGPDPREKPDPRPFGKTGPIFPSAKNGLWTLKKNRTPDPE